MAGMKKAALLVGIDEYVGRPAPGCARDVENLKPLLAQNYDKTANFDCKTLTAPAGTKGVVTRAALREQLQLLMAKHVHMALFYFSGHGIVAPRGTMLMTQDAVRFDEGVDMEEVLWLANESKIPEVVIIIDSCFAGDLGGSRVLRDGYVILREGVAVLAASTEREGSMGASQGSVFTSLVCEALRGGASDVIGEVTAASVYDFAEKLLLPQQQRPQFKANLSQLTPLRMCAPHVPFEVLRRLQDYFPSPDKEYALDPEHDEDPRDKPPGSVRNPTKEAIFRDLRTAAAAHLVEPVGEEYMYWAAIRSKSCRLTPVGQFYLRRAREM